MSMWEMLLWGIVIYLGYNFVVFLINIAVVYFWIVKDGREEDDRNKEEHGQ